MLDISSTNRRALGQCICIITATSKGFGRAMAHEVSCVMNPGSVLLLVARPKPLLHQLREKLQRFSKEPQLVVHRVVADLSTRQGVDEVVRVARQQAFDHVLLINNAGPMDTDMQKDIQRLTGISHHLLPSQESVTKLIKLLLNNDFPSGAHLDFFTL